MYRVTRRSRPTLSVAVAALTAAFTLLPAVAEARERSGNHGSSSGSSHGSAGARSSAPSTSSPSRSSGSGDTRPQSGTPGGRVEADARDGRASSSRGHSGRGGGHGGYYGGHYGYGGGYWNNYYGGWGPYPYGWFGYWGSPYFYWDYSGGYGRTVVYPNNRYGETGALDLDVSPERAEIYLDGERIGTADDFDGFPTLLWLEKGTYDLVIFEPGFRTIARQVSIVPGLVIDVDDRMERGDSVRPEDLMTRSHDRRDARLRADREREAEVDAAEAGRSGDWRARRGRAAQPYRGDIDDRDRRDQRDQRDQDDAEQQDAEDYEDDEGAMRGDSAALRLDIEPNDASVYLDGRFLGTGADLARLPSGIVVEPGEHEIEVVRPGHRAHNQSFSARAGNTVEIEVDLESN